MVIDRIAKNKTNIFRKFLNIKWDYYVQLDSIVSSGRGINNVDGVVIQQNYEMFKEIVEDMKELLRDREEK
jgi:hypothetical protein